MHISNNGNSLVGLAYMPYLSKNILKNLSKIDLVAVYTSKFFARNNDLTLNKIISQIPLILILQKLKTLNEVFIFKHLNKKLFRKMFLLPFIFFENESSRKIVDQFWSIERMAQLLFSGIANNILFCQ